MPTERNRDLFGYEVVEGRRVVAAFDGGEVTSDAGALLLGATGPGGEVRGLLRGRSGPSAGSQGRPWWSPRSADQVEHSNETMVAQRVFGIALGHKDLIDYDQLRHDPVLATLAGKLTARRRECAPLAGKRTLHRLEPAPSTPTRYHKIGHDAGAIEGLFAALFLKAHKTPPLRSSSTSMPPTIPCMATRKAVSSTVTTTAIATCRCTCSAAGICSRPSSDAPFGQQLKSRSISMACNFTVVSEV